MKYQLVVGPDKTVWVSLQPLIEDANESLDKLSKVDTEGLSNIDADIMNFNVMGLKAISTFLSALVKEANSREEVNENITRSTVH
jgi:hypothetical protein